MSDISKIDFYIGTDCPFCFQQCNYVFSGRPGFFYEKIYCEHCTIGKKMELSDSKFEIWFLNQKLISILMSDNIQDKYFHSEYSPIQQEINLFVDDYNIGEDVPLKIWKLKKHFNILYNYILSFDLTDFVSHDGFALKIKQMLDNPNLSKQVKLKILGEEQEN